MQRAIRTDFAAFVLASLLVQPSLANHPNTLLISVASAAQTDDDARAASLTEEAFSKFDEGQIEEALRLHSEALNLRLAAFGERDPRTLQSLHSRGVSFFALRRYPEAEENLSKAFTLRREVLGWGSEDTHFSAYFYGLTLSSLQRNEEAEPLMARVLAEVRNAKGDTDPDLIPLLSSHALVLELLRRSDAAEATYREAMSLSETLYGDRHPRTLSAMSEYTQFLRYAGRLAEAKPLSSKILRLSREINGVDDPATNRYEELHNALLAKALSEGADNTGGYGFSITAEISAAMEEVYNPPDVYAAENPQAALERSAEILEALRPFSLFAVGGGDWEYYRRAVSMHANNLGRMGKASEAADLFEESVELHLGAYSAVSYRVFQARMNYYAALAEQGRFEQSIDLLERLIEDMEQANKRAGVYPFALANLGRSYVASQRHEDAFNAFDKLIRSLPADLAANNPNRLVFEADRANAQRLAFGLASNSVIAELEDINRRFEAPEFAETTAQATAERYLADAYLADGQVEKAKALFLSLQEDLKNLVPLDHPISLLVADSLAETHLKDFSRTGSASAGEAAFTFAIETLRLREERLDRLPATSVANALQRREERARLQESRLLLADTLWETDRRDQIEEALGVLQAASSQETTGAIAQAAARRIAAADGAIGLVDQMEQLSAIWNAQQQRLTSLTQQQNGDDLALARQRIDEISAEYDEARAELARMSPRFYEILEQPALELETLQSDLSADEALLLIVPSSRGTHLLAITRDRVKWHRANVDAQRAQEWISDLRLGLDPEEVLPGELPFFDAVLAHEMHQALIAPIADVIEGRETLQIAAAGVYSRIPFSVLVTQLDEDNPYDNSPQSFAGTAWFGDQHSLVQLPSIQSLLFLRRYNSEPSRQQTGKFVGFGNPVLEGANDNQDLRSGSLRNVSAQSTGTHMSRLGSRLMSPDALRRLSQLPGTENELRSVSSSLSDLETVVFLSYEMTEAATKGVDYSSARILHFATHGLTASQSGELAEPGLVFTPPQVPSLVDDGYLSASEVVALDLSGTRWVILSACNTAAPSGENNATGLTGLAKSFFYSGSSTLLATHWAVYDDVAAQLTSSTLLRSEEGMPAATALKLAIQDLRNDESMDASHPSVWAPFTLVGEGR